MLISKEKLQEKSSFQSKDTCHFSYHMEDTNSVSEANENITSENNFQMQGSIY